MVVGPAPARTRVVARCGVSLRNDRFIRDHVLSGPVSDSDPELFGLACMPLMVSLELMAEACALLAGSTDVRVIENVKAFDPTGMPRSASARIATGFVARSSTDAQKT